MIDTSTTLSLPLLLQGKDDKRPIVVALSVFSLTTLAGYNKTYTF